jgi:hypothetical protein
MVSKEEGVRVTRKTALIISLILIALIFTTGASLLSSYLEYKHFAQSQEAQSQVINHKLCSTMTGLSLLRAPQGDPSGNPSRAYEQALQSKLSELSIDIGC